MSSKELDKLFKDKLEGMDRAPSSNAWSSVEARMAEKKGAWFYLRIAAAIALLITFASLYYMNTYSGKGAEKSLTEKIYSADTIKTASTKTERQIIDLPETAEKNLVEMDTAKTKRNNQQAPSLNEPMIKKDNLTQNTSNTVPDDMPGKIDSASQSPVLKHLGQEKVLIAENVEVDATTEGSNASTQPENIESGTTLIFDIEDFDMKTAVTKAYDAAEETKKSGFKKVLEFVKSVKEGEAGLGGLREAKNNLLSIKQKEKEDGNSK